MVAAKKYLIKRYGLFRPLEIIHLGLIRYYKKERMAIKVELPGQLKQTGRQIYFMVIIIDQ